MTLFNQDVFINVAGGIRVNEPAVDLGIVAAIVSSRSVEKQVPPYGGVRRSGPYR